MYVIIHERCYGSKISMLKRGEEPVLQYMDFSGMKYYNRQGGSAACDYSRKEGIP